MREAISRAASRSISRYVSPSLVVVGDARPLTRAYRPDLSGGDRVLARYGEDLLHEIAAARQTRHETTALTHLDTARYDPASARRTRSV